MTEKPDTATARWSSLREILVASVLLFSSGLATLAGNVLIHVRFPDRPYPQDLLLQMLPYVNFTQYLTAVAIVGSLAVLLIYVIRRTREQLAEIIAVFGIMYLMRAVLMVLTPLANAYDGSGHYGLIPLDQDGMFPSGHAGASLLCFLLINAHRAPVLRRIALGLMATQLTALLLSHGHFSIDLAGGMLLAYFVHREWRDGSIFSPVQRLMGMRTCKSYED